MEEERDFVVFTDENGEEFELDVIDYFEHEGQEYAVLMDLAGLECDEECDHDEEGECDCGEAQDVYIMKIVVNGEDEEFLPADDDKMDALAEIVEARLSGGCGCGDDGCDCDGDCGCGDGDCGCEAQDAEKECGCGCGHPND